MLVAFLGSGYLVWRYRETTGGLEYDKEKLKEVFSDEYDGAKIKLATAKRVIEKASIETVADARKLLTSVDAWLKARKVAPATREELKDVGEKYERESGHKPTPIDLPVISRPTGRAEPVEPAEPAVETPSVSIVARAEKARRAKTIARGLEEFRAGFKHWQTAGSPGSPREQTELALARVRFTSAQDILTPLQEDAPDDPEIEKLLVETNRFLYDCLKRLKVDVRAGT
jgi:hypothetical protein